MKRLHADFLDSQEAFDRAKKYWQSLFESCAKEMGVSSQWKPLWGETEFCAPYTDMDAVSVFSAQDQSGSRGVQITQWNARTGPEVISAYTKTFSLHTDKPLYLLVIVVTPTESTVAICRSLLNIWLMPSDTMKRLSVTIDPEHFIRKKRKKK